VQRTCRRELAGRAAGSCASVPPWVQDNIISARPSKQYLLKIYTELGSYFVSARTNKRHYHHGLPLQVPRRASAHSPRRRVASAHPPRELDPDRDSVEKPERLRQLPKFYVARFAVDQRGALPAPRRPLSGPAPPKHRFAMGTRPCLRRAAAAAAGGDGAREARKGPGQTQTPDDAPETARLRRGDRTSALAPSRTSNQMTTRHSRRRRAGRKRHDGKADDNERGPRARPPSAEGAQIRHYYRVQKGSPRRT